MKLIITDDVYDRLVLKRKKLKREDDSVRIILRSEGCGGTSLAYYFTHKVNSDDELQYRELEFIADKKLVERFEGFEIFSEHLFAETKLRVKPINEDVSKGCSGGCGNKN